MTGPTNNDASMVVNEEITQGLKDLGEKSPDLKANSTGGFLGKPFNGIDDITRRLIAVDQESLQIFVIQKAAELKAKEDLKIAPGTPGAEAEAQLEARKEAIAAEQQAFQARLKELEKTPDEIKAMSPQEKSDWNAKRLAIEAERKAKAPEAFITEVMRKIQSKQKAADTGLLVMGTAERPYANQLADVEVFRKMSVLLQAYADTQKNKGDKKNDRLGEALGEMIRSAHAKLNGLPEYKNFVGKDLNSDLLFKLVANMTVAPATAEPIQNVSTAKVESPTPPPPPPPVAARKMPPPLPTQSTEPVPPLPTIPTEGAVKSATPPPLPETLKKSPPPLPDSVTKKGPPPLPDAVTKKGPPPLPNAAAKPVPPPIPQGFAKQSMFSKDSHTGEDTKPKGPPPLPPGFKK